MVVEEKVVGWTRRIMRRMARVEIVGRKIVVVRMEESFLVRGRLRGRIMIRMVRRWVAWMASSMAARVSQEVFWTRCVRGRRRQGEIWVGRTEEKIWVALLVSAAKRITPAMAQAPMAPIWTRIALPKRFPSPTL